MAFTEERIRKMIAAYNSDDPDDGMTEDEAAAFEEGIRSGQIVLPSGFQVAEVGAGAGANIDQLERPPTPDQAPETTMSGLAGGLTRGAGPAALGAAIGGGLGAFGGPLAPISVPAGAAAGAGAMFLTKTIGPWLVKAVNNLFGVQITDPNEAFEMFADAAGVERPDTLLERAVQTGGEAVGAGLGIAGIGSTVAKTAQNPVVKGASEAIAAQPGLQVAAGATGGGGSEVGRATAEKLGAGETGQNLVATGAGMLAGQLGSVAARTLPNVRATRVAPPKERPQAIEDVQKYLGKELPTSDALSVGTYGGRVFQTMGERVPLLGVGGRLKNIQRARVKAVADEMENRGVTKPSNVLTDEILEDLARKHGENLTKYTRMKTEVIDRLAEGGDVPVQRTIRQINKEIGTLRRASQQSVPDGEEPIDTRLFAKAIKELTRFRDALPGKNLNEIELLRKRLGDSFVPANMGNVRKAGEAAVSRIYGPLNEDMGGFIKILGNRRDFTKWKVANKRLSQMIDEMDNSAIGKVLKNEKYNPEKLDPVLFGAAPNKAALIYKNLSVQGKKDYRTALVAKAGEKATIQATDGEYVDPTRFAKALNDMRGQFNVAYDAKELTALNGLKRALFATERAGRFTAHPPTGTQIYFAAFWKTLGLLGAPAGLLARLYESPTVREKLVKLGTIKMNTPVGQKEAAATFKQFVAATQNAAARGELGNLSDEDYQQEDEAQQ